MYKVWHKVRLERLEYLLTKEQNEEISEAEDKEISRLIEKCTKFENKYYPIESIN
jgi:hypothetical protein